MKHVQGKITETEWVAFRKMAIEHRTTVSALLRLMIRALITGKTTYGLSRPAQGSPPQAESDSKA